MYITYLHEKLEDNLYKIKLDISNLDEYIKQLGDGILPRQNDYILSDKERVNELIGFGLRINNGIDLSEIPMEFQNEVNRSIVQIESKWGNYFIQKRKNRFTYGRF